MNIFFPLSFKKWAVLYLHTNGIKKSSRIRNNQSQYTAWHNSRRCGGKQRRWIINQPIRNSQLFLENFTRQSIARHSIFLKKYNKLDEYICTYFFIIPIIPLNNFFYNNKTFDPCDARVFSTIIETNK